ncbi:hypothetical protein EBS02_01660 [bacterium]|nr:hypothetical protein [bacterium]
MAYRIVLRQDTSTNWTSNNPTLLSGELGFETDTNQLKIGNGSDAWNNLGYYPYSGLAGNFNLASGQFWSTTFTGATAGIDWNNSNVQKMTLTTNTTFTFQNGRDGGEYALVLKQGASGDYTVTWPESVSWSGGTGPTMTSTANAYDVYKFVYTDNKYFATASQNYS